MTEEAIISLEGANLYKRIQAIMSELSFVKKTEPKSKEEGLAYSYVKHDDVTSAIHPLLVKYGIVIIPNVTSSKCDSFNVTFYNQKFKKEITKTVYTAEVVLSLKLVNVDDPKDFVESSWNGFGMDTQDKAIGKAYSYAYKYGILKTFALETGDDDVEVDRKEYVRETTSLVGSGGIDWDIKKEALDAFFEQSKEKLLAFDSMEKMQKFWTDNWKDICKLDKPQTSELINIKDNMKLKLEGKV